jgi:hypothetical protein
VYEKPVNGSFIRVAGERHSKGERADVPHHYLVWIAITLSPDLYGQMMRGGAAVDEDFASLSFLIRLQNHQAAKKYPHCRVIRQIFHRCKGHESFLLR